jgi:tight adherence protein C
MPLYAVIILVFFGVASVLFFLIYLLFPTKTFLEERLESMTEEAARAEILSSKKPVGLWQNILDMLGSQVPLRPEEYGQYRKMLVAAGIRGERLPIYMGAKVFSAGIFPAVYLLLGAPAKEGPMIAAAILIALAIVGFLSPSFWLSKMTKRRQLKIFHDLPDILDLMTVCVEAGLSMEAAMVRIAEDKHYARTPLGLEMTTAVRETRAGKLRVDSLRDMGERAMEEDLRAFAAMLIQTEQLGTSLADALRIHSDSLRTKRRQKAEEAAAKTAVKLLFPLVFFLMPPLLIIVLLPALIRMGNFFAGMQ